MYSILQALLSDKKGGAVFSCFGPWHWGYILLTFAAIAAAGVRLRGRDRQERERGLNLWIGLAFGMYIADFFLMPFAYGEIDVEKLPFHVCTAMCVMCFISRRSAALRPWRRSLALLGFLSNLVYLIYPAGVMWHQVHPASYRVVQTLLFHGIMTAYGFLALVFEEDAPAGKTWLRDLAVLIGMTAWAMLGNFLYGGHPRFFNWFFVVRDPFYLLPEQLAPWIMPFLNVAVFFTAERLLIRLLPGRKS